MQDNKTINCSDCYEKCDQKTASICTICFKNNKESYLCTQHYNKGLKRAEEYNLQDGVCVCYKCWISWFNDENIDSDDF